MQSRFINELKTNCEDWEQVLKDHPKIPKLLKWWDDWVEMSKQTRLIHPLNLSEDDINYLDSPLIDDLQKAEMQDVQDAFYHSTTVRLAQWIIDTFPEVYRRTDKKKALEYACQENRPKVLRWMFENLASTHIDVQNPIMWAIQAYMFNWTELFNTLKELFPIDNIRDLERDCLVLQEEHWIPALCGRLLIDDHIKMLLIGGPDDPEKARTLQRTLGIVELHSTALVVISINNTRTAPLTLVTTPANLTDFQYVSIELAGTRTYLNQIFTPGGPRNSSYNFLVTNLNASPGQEAIHFKPL